jgi:hypothetical protein
MLINTIQEEHTLGDSSIQSASGNLIDANSGDDGSARFFQEQEAFLAQYEIEIELDAQHRQFAPIGHVYHSQYQRAEHTIP